MPSNFVSQLEQKDEQVRNYIKEKEQDCEKLKNELEKLQQDFIYNLQLLNDRDRELATFEDTILELRNNIGERDARINHVSILLDEKSQLVENLKVFVKESEQARVNLLQKEKILVDEFHQKLEILKEEFASQKSQYEAEIREREHKLELQSSSHLNSLARQTHSHELSLEAIRRDAHEHILQAQQKYQVAEQETIEVKNSLNDLESKWQNLVDENRSADKKYRDLQFEFNDYAKSSRARINLVESALQKCHQESETRAESLNQQRNKLILEFQQEKNTLNLEISKRDNQIIDLKSRVESLHKMYTNLQQEKVNETKQTETCRINANKERIEFEHQIQVIKTDHENKVMALRSEISKRDLILEGFDKKVVQLHSLIDTKQYDIDNLKNELSKMIDNEKKLEEKLLNCNVQWEMKFNELNGKKMRENDKLFHQIVKAKENAQEEVRYLTEQLSLKSRGVNMDSDEALRYQIKDLQDQNLQLSDIISQMRRDMESFAAKKLNTADDSEHQILLNDNQSLNDQVTKLNIILSQKQNMINNLLDQQTNLNESFGRNIGNNGIVIERENEKLRAQLTELKGDLSREMQEKNVLLELSNYLKSELRSFQDTANDSLPKKTEARIQSNEKIAPPKFFVGTKKAPIAPVKLDTKFELRSKGIRNWNEKDD